MEMQIKIRIQDIKDIIEFTENLKEIKNKYKLEKSKTKDDSICMKLTLNEKDKKIVEKLFKKWEVN